MQIFISSNTMMTYCLSFLILFALSPSALLQVKKDLEYELWNSDSLKNCKCNYTLDLTPICENKDVTYDKKEMSDCINKCSEKSTLNIIHTRECSEKSFGQPLSKPLKNCRDCKLTNDFQPVCGTDGVTYPNPSYLFCVADCEKPGLMYSHCGFCLDENRGKPRDNDVMMDEYQRKVSKELLDTLATCDCIIKYNLNPVCGSDDSTYPNPSMLYCLKKCRKPDLQIKSCGKCSSEAPQRFSEPDITFKFSDNINKCLADCPVILNIDPVCGTDGKTYDSISDIKCYKACTNESISVKHRGSCKLECNCKFERKFNPVCGSDGNTYANPSALFCAEQCEKADLKLSYCGACQTKPIKRQKELKSDFHKEAKIPEILLKIFETCGCVFTREDVPVCGSDGTVYGNPSVFYCTKKCMARPDITIKNCGLCNKEDEQLSTQNMQHIQKDVNSLLQPFVKCDCVATSTLYPVCGNDGVTYPHPSYIYCTKNCKANDMSAEKLEMAYCGPCKDVEEKLTKPNDEQATKLSAESLDIFEKCNCKVSREWNPVCGTTGVTYSNPSIFYCSKKCINQDLHIKHCGICQEKDNPKNPLNNVNNLDEDDDDPNKCRCTATREYKPICGSDGNNYANPAVFECIKNCTKQNINVAHDGLCNYENEESPITSIRSARSVAEDDKSSMDIDDKSTAKLDYLLGCDCLVTTDYSPVCGTDGLTYPNLSQLTCNNECKRRTVLVAHYGPCHHPVKPDKPSVPQACKCVHSYEYAPLCGSDGETYGNPSQLSCNNYCGNKNVTKVYNGRCVWERIEEHYGPSECFCEIVYEHSLVCGTDSRTYISPSYLHCVNKCEKRVLNIAHDGACHHDKDKYPNYAQSPSDAEKCKCIVTHETDLVCASDKQTYSSASYVICVNKCKNQNLHIMHNGPCRKEDHKLLSLSTWLQETKPHVYKTLSNTQKKCLSDYCPKTYEIEPVCASDGLTYENRLHVACARNCYDPDVIITSSLACVPSLANDVRECKCQNPFMTELICGSDGRVYPHPTTFLCIKSCKNPRLTQRDMRFCGSIL